MFKLPSFYDKESDSESDHGDDRRREPVHDQSAEEGANNEEGIAEGRDEDVAQIDRDMSQSNEIGRVKSPVSSPLPSPVPAQKRTFTIFGGDSVQEDFDKFVTYNNQNKGWSLLASPPKVGTSMRMKIALQNAKLRSPKDDEMQDEELGGMHLSADWKNALVKYEINATTTQPMLENENSNKKLKKCRPAYFDIRGLREYAEILSGICSQMYLPLSADLAAARENLLHAVSKEEQATMIVIDHVHKDGIDVLFNIFSFISDRVGIIVIADVSIRAVDKYFYNSNLNGSRDNLQAASRPGGRSASQSLASHSFGSPMDGIDLSSQETKNAERFISEINDCAAKMALEWNDASDTSNERVLVFTGLLSIREARGLAAKIVSKGNIQLLTTLLKGGEGEETEEIRQLRGMVDLIATLGEGVPGLITKLATMPFELLESIRMALGKESKQHFRLMKSKYITAGRMYLSFHTIYRAILNPENNMCTKQTYAILQAIIASMDYFDCSTVPLLKQPVFELVFHRGIIWLPATKQEISEEDCKPLVQLGLLYKVNDLGVYHLPSYIMENYAMLFPIYSSKEYAREGENSESSDEALTIANKMFLLDRPSVFAVYCGRDLMNVSQLGLVPELTHSELIRNVVMKIQKKTYQFGVHFHQLIRLLVKQLKKVTTMTDSVNSNVSFNSTDETGDMEEMMILSTSLSLLGYSKEILYRALPVEERTKLILYTAEALANVSIEQIQNIIAMVTKKFGTLGEAFDLPMPTPSAAAFILEVVNGIVETLFMLFWNKGHIIPKPQEERSSGGSSPGEHHSGSSGSGGNQRNYILNDFQLPRIHGVVQKLLTAFNAIGDAEFAAAINAVPSSTFVNNTTVTKSPRAKGKKEEKESTQGNSSPIETYKAFLKYKSIAIAYKFKLAVLIENFTYEKSIQSLELQKLVEEMEEIEIKLRLLKSEVPYHDLPNFLTLGELVKKQLKANLEKEREQNREASGNSSPTKPSTAIAGSAVPAPIKSSPVVSFEIAEHLHSLRVSAAVAEMRTLTANVLLWILSRNEFAAVNSSDDSKLGKEEDLIRAQSGRFLLLLQQEEPFVILPFDRMRMFQHICSNVTIFDHHIPRKKKADEFIRLLDQQEKKHLMNMDVTVNPFHKKLVEEVKQCFDKALHEYSRIFTEKSLIASHVALRLTNVMVFQHRILLLREIVKELRRVQEEGDEWEEEELENNNDDDEDENDEVEGGTDEKQKSKLRSKKEELLEHDLSKLSEECYESLKGLLEKRNLFVSMLTTFRKYLTVVDLFHWSYRVQLATIHSLQGEYLVITTMPHDEQLSYLMNMSKDMFRHAYKVCKQLPYNNEYYHYLTLSSSFYGILLAKKFPPHDAANDLIATALQFLRDERFTMQYQLEIIANMLFDGLSPPPLPSTPYAYGGPTATAALGASSPDGSNNTSYVNEEVIYNFRSCFFIHDLSVACGKTYDEIMMNHYAIPILKDMLYRYRDLNTILYDNAHIVEWKLMIKIIEKVSLESIPVKFANTLCLLGNSLCRDALRRTGQLSMLLTSNVTTSIVKFQPNTGPDILFKQAIRALIRAAGVYEHDMKPRDSAVYIMRVLRQLALTYLQQLDFVEAKACYEQIMRLFLEIPFVTREQIADVQLEMANVLVSNKEYFEAILILQQAADSYRNMIESLLRDRLREAEAKKIREEKEAKKAQAIAKGEVIDNEEDEEDEDKPRTILLTPAQEADRERIRDKALRRLKKKLAQAMFRKATTLIDEQDYDQAQECAQLSIRLYSEVFPDAVDNEENTGSNEKKDENKSATNDDVKNELKKTVVWSWTYFEPGADEENPEDGPIVFRAEVAACYSLIAAIHHHYEELEDAKLLYERSHEVYIEIRMEESVEMAKVCHNLGAVYDDMVRFLP